MNSMTMTIEGVLVLRLTKLPTEKTMSLTNSNAPHEAMLPVALLLLSRHGGTWRHEIENCLEQRHDSVLLRWRGSSYRHMKTWRGDLPWRENINPIDKPVTRCSTKPKTTGGETRTG